MRLPLNTIKSIQGEKVTNEFAFLNLNVYVLVVYFGDFQSVLSSRVRQNNWHVIVLIIYRLMKGMKKWQLSPIDRRNYERFRKSPRIYRQAE